MSRHGLTRIRPEAPVEAPHRSPEERHRRRSGRLMRAIVRAPEEDALPEVPRRPSPPERVLALAVIFQALLDLELRAMDPGPRYTAAAFLTGHPDYVAIRDFWCAVADVDPAQLAAQAWADYARQIHGALLYRAPRIDTRRNRRRRPAEAGAHV